MPGTKTRRDRRPRAPDDAGLLQQQRQRILLPMLLPLLLLSHPHGADAAFAAASPSPSSPPSRMPPQFEPLPPRPAEGAGARPPVLLHDWTGLGLTSYERAWVAQHALLDRRLALRQQQQQQEKAAPTTTGAAEGEWWRGDRLLLLQHPPTYTLGTGSTPDNLRFDPADASAAPAALFRTERGGEATWHGPGQIVAYPLLDLQGGYRADLHWWVVGVGLCGWIGFVGGRGSDDGRRISRVAGRGRASLIRPTMSRYYHHHHHHHRYLRALEEVVIRAMRPLGVEGGREEGLTGVWTSKGKVAVSGLLLLLWEPVDRCDVHTTSCVP